MSATAPGSPSLPAPQALDALAELALNTSVAYFCMEFMLSEAPPIYSGRLGNAAGDQLKARYGLKIAVVSNEGRELNAHRIRMFKLGAPADAFISSSFVHIRKPDADIFRLALEIAQASARRVVYIENTPMFVQVAEGLGIRSILHRDYRSTRAKLAAFGLRVD